MIMRSAVISVCLLTLCCSFANSLNLKNLKKAGKNMYKLVLFVCYMYLGDIIFDEQSIHLP